ncbi:DUF1476 domain-containing protein [Azospirillum sp. YIM DDC1]|uniref:DUF1476 domain-containing protein n=1 Tax=Azospirillum aestuarii TaxID=2802052 RepID=A0ABS1HWA4_9PROT|nr:DUF1476 domain-containing protein [Azospirillum aestuarii]MBK3777841.1 DUF1476 family protein [Azospirillum brasilense]MBK4719105.1 DUF1476 domain-containing protein [Azospirillum aestuarii]TWA90530.1 hypothetical protein FBY14_10432 [Azospirillum brasilense]
MTTFDERERAFENKFQHDQDLLFRIRARRDRLAGLWAASLLGLTGGEADAYVRQIIDADISATGPHDIRDRLAADLHARGVDISDHRVEKELAQLLDVARQQVHAE